MKTLNYIRRYYAPTILILIVIGVFTAFLVMANQLHQSRLADQKDKEHNDNFSRILAELDLNRADSSLFELLNEFKDNSQKQTLILCRIILRDNIKLTPEDEAEIEAICQEEINRGNSSPAQPNTQNSTSHNGNSQPQNTNGQGASNPPSPPPSPPPPPPSLLEQITMPVTELLDRITL